MNYGHPRGKTATPIWLVFLWLWAGFCILSATFFLFTGMGFWAPTPETPGGRDFGLIMFHLLGIVIPTFATACYKEVI